VLPLDPDTHRRLRQLGIKTLGALVALPEEAVVSQFGRRPAGGCGARAEARIGAGSGADRTRAESWLPSRFSTQSASGTCSPTHWTKLVDRAIADPRRSGWRVQVVRLRAELEHGASWLVTATLKDPSATRERIAAPLKTLLERSPPAGAVERLVVEFTAFAPAPRSCSCSRAMRAPLRAPGGGGALQSAAREIALRIRRPMLYHVTRCNHGPASPSGATR